MVSVGAAATLVFTQPLWVVGATYALALLARVLALHASSSPPRSLVLAPLLTFVDLPLRPGVCEREREREGEAGLLCDGDAKPASRSFAIAVTDV